MRYGLIFCGNSSDSKRVFMLQKKIIRIMLGEKPQNSCRELFKRLQILPSPREFIYIILKFIVRKWEYFQTNSTVHSVNIRNKHQLHTSIINLSCYQKSTHLGIKIFNKLPSNLKSLMNMRIEFRVALKRYFIMHSFYSVDEFLLFKTYSSS
jgi:hypothetical protein